MERLFFEGGGLAAADVVDEDQTAAARGRVVSVASTNAQDRHTARFTSAKPLYGTSHSFQPDQATMLASG